MKTGKWIKNTLLLPGLLFLSANTFAQKVETYLKEGLKKHREKDFKGAIEAYGKAVKTDKNLRDGYFNRGICELAIKDFAAAKNDFDRSIELDPVFAKAYYSRATALVSQDLYTAAMADLDKSLELDEHLTTALTLRGQIRAQTGDRMGACADFLQAHALGDPKGAIYFDQFCAGEKQATESFTLQWPETETWAVGKDQENGAQHSIDFIHPGETLDNWTELANMTAVKGATEITVEKAMDALFDHMRQFAPKAKLSFIEKDEKAIFPWILFSIEAPRFKGDRTPESQLWYVIRGKQKLYTNFIAIKSPVLPAALKEKWSSFFKAGKMIYL